MNNIFDKEICVDCDNNCSPGTGRYVNRYQFYGDDIEGWRCGICAEEIETEFNENKGQ